jgi:hypothetical protein
MSVGRDNRKKGGRRIIFTDRSENSRFKAWLYILFLPILAQGLSAVFLEDLSAVFIAGCFR